MSERKLLRQFSLGNTCLQQYSDGSKIKIRLIKADIDEDLVDKICEELNEKKLAGTLTKEEQAILNMLEIKFKK
jgi:signal recognition particle GTPase